MPSLSNQPSDHASHQALKVAEPKHYVLVSPIDYGAVDRFSLTYSSQTPLAIGQIVKVPLGRKTSLGIITGVTPKPKFATKPVEPALDLPPLPIHLVGLAQWLADYYMSSPKNVWQTLLPAGLTVRKTAARRLSETAYTLPDAPQLKPTAEQAAAIQAIETGAERSYLLHGVTGSGKTLVYLELAKKVLAAGRSVIVMVPEIALTPQLEAHFRQSFGDIIVPTHSGLTPAGRRAAWLQVLYSQKPQVIIGPRSSLFLPLKNLGLIIIDECHETTYKQDQSPRYQTEAAAAKLAGLSAAKLVLGSATPSLSQLFLAEHRKLGLVKLMQRANQLIPAQAVIVDLRDKTNQWPGRLLSRPLFTALEQTLAEGRQSVLFINRRGSASSLICTDCGYVATCPHCSIPLTFHADTARLLCHYCGYQITPPAVCPDCHGATLRYLGGGTKRVEAEVARFFPKARLSRLDRDSSDARLLHQTYSDLRAGRVDILIGTQMVAKGLDLPAVDTVGIVSADTLLHLPDYTASERTFQLITQVSGRTGRGDRPGQIIIQTYSPDHPAITSAANGDFEGFAKRELVERQQLGYPPFVYILKLTCALKTTEAASKKASEAATTLRTLPNLNVLGPTPAFHQQLSGLYRQQIILRSKSRPPLIAAAKLISSGWTVDPDPVNLL